MPLRLLEILGGRRDNKYRRIGLIYHRLNEDCVDLRMWKHSHITSNKLSKRPCQKKCGVTLPRPDKIRKFEMRSFSNAPKVKQDQRPHKHDERKQQQQPRLARPIRSSTSHQTSLCQIPSVNLHSQCATNALANTQRPAHSLHMDNTTRSTQQHRKHTLLQSHMSEMANLPLVQRHCFPRLTIQ